MQRSSYLQLFYYIFIIIQIGLTNRKFELHKEDWGKVIK